MLDAIAVAADHLSQLKLEGREIVVGSCGVGAVGGVLSLFFCGAASGAAVVDGEPGLTSPQGAYF